MCDSTSTFSYVNGQRYDSQDTTGFEIKLSGDLLICSPRFLHLCRFGSGGSGRTGISAFSKGSRGRMQKYLRESEAEYTTFITLTYPLGYGRDGHRCKRDLRCFGKRFLRYARHDNDGCPPSLFWFMEFTKAGTMHYHLLVNRWLPKRLVSEWWYECVGSEDARHLAIGTRTEAVRGGRRGYRAYAAKYAKKLDQKLVPDGFGFSGRFWGVVGSRSVVVAATFVTAREGRSVLVQEALKAITSTMYDSVFSGKTRRLYADKGYNVRVYVVRDSYLLIELRTLISKLNKILADLAVNLFYLPELAYIEGD